MTEHRCKVRCRLRDCMFYEGEANEPGFIICTHKDKPNFLKAHPCPLYRLDWKRKATAARQLIDSLKRA